jgi:pantoate--beta-alanine ligase
MSEIHSSIALLRTSLSSVQCSGKSIGLVPTMGALHLGHRHLLETARAQNDFIVASIFVNPTQFERKDDLDRYPRTIEEDLALCREAGVDFVFTPPASEMYPEPQLTWVEAPSLAEHLCGAGRPGHFRGVATVVMKLFQIVRPDRAYFGEKDAQQLAIIQRMTLDLNIPVTIVPVATVREPDGLAVSSRNTHLNESERRIATVLSQALFAAREMATKGERSTHRICEAVQPLFIGHNYCPAIRVEYFSIVDRATLQPVELIESPVLIAGAIWIGKTRLIDNVAFSPEQG